MPRYKRTRTRTRRARRVRRRPTYRRRSVRSKTKTYFFKRNVLRTGITQTVTNDNLGAMTFKLDDVANYSEYLAMFDRYKICAIKIRFIPQYNVAQMATPNQNNVVPKLFTLIDVNDSSPPSNLNEMRQYSNVKVTRGYYQKKIYFRPMIAAGVYQGGTYGAAMNTRGWISTSDYQVVHYGIKYGIDAAGATQTQLQKWDIECVYYMAFKQPK